jgi:Zn-dependent peptidase ImmA (M78 family)
MKRRTFTIPVAFATYTVKMVKSLPRAAAQVDLQKREILIADGTSAENWKATLMHEYFHALLWELGRSDLCDNEAFVEGLAIALTRLKVEIPSL